MAKHPMQPFEMCNGIVRFKRNVIVEFLLDNGGIDLNEIACRTFSQDDRVQFAQLIGYSLSGFHELNYVPDAVALEASREARRQLGDERFGGCRDDGCEIHCGVESE